MKRTSANPPDAEPAGGPAAPDHERRVMRGVVHDHKDTAQLQWYDAAEDYERKLLELEEKSNPLEQGGGRGLDTRGLSVKEDDNFDPTPAVRRRMHGQPGGGAICAGYPPGSG